MKKFHIPHFGCVYDMVSAFGNECATAMYLNRHYLRTTSAPWDWTGDNRSVLLDYVEMLEKNDLGFTTAGRLALAEDPNMDDPQHDLYRDKVSGLWFAHDFPVGVPIEQSFGAFCKKYQRRFERFKHNLSTLGKVLLIHHCKFETVTEKNAREALRRLRAMFPNGQIDLLVINLDEKMTRPELRELGDGLYFAAGKIAGEGFDRVMGNYAHLDPIFAAIRLHGHFRNKFKMKWARLRLRMATMFILNREKRRAARAKLKGSMFS